MQGKKKHLIVKRKTKTPGVLYFHEGTQHAIEKYQKTSDNFERSQIYKSDILPAFDKLVENLIFMHGFNKHGEPFDSLKNDCITFLYETICKFDGSRGTKAFSYFNVVARNWLIIKSKQKVKRNKRHVSIDDTESLSSSQKHAIENFNVLPSPDDIMIDKNKILEINALMQQIKRKVSGESEIACIDAIIKIFSHVDELEFLNKRAVFLYIRDLSNLNAQQLAIAMSVIRKHYKNLSKIDFFDIF